MYHCGKISNLPNDLVEQLNFRLHDGFSGPVILRWLNKHKDARQTIQDFGGVPFSKQNLSQWRNGGYQEWRVRIEFEYFLVGSLYNGAQTREVEDVNLIADHLAAEVAALYAKFLATWDGEPTPKAQAQLRVLRGLNKDIALLQKTMERADQHMLAYEEAKEDKIQKKVNEAFLQKLEDELSEARSNQVKAAPAVKPKEEENKQNTDTEDFTEEQESNPPVPPPNPVKAETSEDQPNPTDPQSEEQLATPKDG